MRFCNGLKLWISLVTLTMSLSLQALPVGNPWEASLHTDGVFCKGDCPSYKGSSRWSDAWSYRIGFYGDFVFDRHMQVDTKPSNAHLHNTTIHTQAAYIACNAWNRIDLFCTLGTTNIRFAAPEKTFGNPVPANDHTILETVTDFSWSFGVRGTLWQCGCLGVGAEAQFLSARPSVNFAHNLGFESLEYQPSNVILKYREWQIGVGVAYRINIMCNGTAFIPYFAIKGGRATMGLDNFSIPSGANRNTFFNLECDDNWGYAVGATLLGCNKLSVTAEARFIGEKALYINSQLRF